MSEAVNARFLVLVTLASLSLSTHAYLRKPSSLKHTRPEMWMSSPQLAKMRGYPMETHEVRTEDGYLLTMHRIPHGRRNASTNGNPVLLGHGLCSSDEQWLVRDDKNLVLDLADLGFDVWLGNYRGSFYSRRHENLDPRSHEFWDFSWHENGVLDQTALIDYVLRATGRAQLLVVGHSMSSTAQLVLLADRPEYNAKIRANVLLAPPAYFNYSTGFLHIVNGMFRGMAFVRDAASRLIVNDFMPGMDRPFPQSCLNDWYSSNPKVLPHCLRLFAFALGPLHEPLDIKTFQTILYHYPAGASIRQVLHYAQCISAGRDKGGFRKYDFGPKKNYALYGSTVPPSYNLTRITSPLYLYYSEGDGTVNYKDVENFAKDLPQGVLKKLRKIPSKVFNHIDYLVHIRVYDVLYKDVIADLLKYLD